MSEQQSHLSSATEQRAAAERASRHGRPAAQESPSTETPSTETPAQVVPDYLPLRIGLLIVLILVIQFWLQHHFGFSFWAGLTSGVVVSVILSVTKFIWEGFFGEDDERWKKPLQRLVIFLVQFPVLAGFALLLLIVGSLVSTVTVIGAGHAGPTRVTLYAGSQLPPADHGPARSGAGGIESAKDASTKTLKEGDATKWFVRVTNPFGRLFTLKAEGFQPYVFDLPAWRGARIDLSRDLNRTPTLFVRIPVNKLAVAGTGNVALYRINSQGPETLLGQGQMKERHGTVVFGRHVPVPERFVSRWDWEATSVGGDQQGVARVLLQWQKEIHVDALPGLISGWELHAKLHDAAGETLASKRFVLSEAPLQDILMIAENDE